MGRLRSSNSKIISFTPIDAFKAYSIHSVRENQTVLLYHLLTDPLGSYPDEQTGILVTQDNSGIVGRTEVLLGYIQMQIGPEVIVQDRDGKQKVLHLEMDIGYSPPFGNMTVSYKETSSVRSWGIQPNELQIFKDDENGNDSGQTPTLSPDTTDECPNDTAKTKVGVCGCGNPELDSNGDKVTDCGMPFTVNVSGETLRNAPSLEFLGTNLSVIMEAFAAFNTAAIQARAKKSNKENNGSKTPKIEATYEITAKLRDSKLKCATVKLESKKNTATIKTKNLIGGTYDVSYKLVFKQGKKKLGQTSKSPASSTYIVTAKTKCPPKKKKK